jgi:hypothetical protein
MTGDTKSHGIGGFHGRIESTPEYNPRREAHNQYRPVRAIAYFGPKRTALVITHKRIAPCDYRFPWRYELPIASEARNFTPCFTDDLDGGHLIVKLIEHERTDWD